MTLKILGAGLGRTGTHSLKLALEILGFGPCHHMSEVGKNAQHVDLWNKSITAENIDWQVLYRDYHAAVDWPTVSFLPQLLQQYPEAKVILTLREPEQWYESARDTIFRLSVLSELAPNMEEKLRAELSERLILREFFSNRYRDKSFCLDVYNQHVKNIRTLVSRRNLLEYHVAEGWEPLCDFLGVAVPDDAFPKTNDRKSFLSRQIQGK